MILEQENLWEPENSSSWSSFTSLAKDRVETETDLDITTPSKDESGKRLEDEDISSVCSEPYGDELDEKLNEEYSSSMECSPQGSHHSKATES